MTEVAKLGLVWFFLSLAFAIGMARWFRFLRLREEDDDAGREWHG